MGVREELQKIHRGSYLNFSVAQQELLDTVDGILERTMPVETATAYIRCCQKEQEEGVGTVAPDAIESAIAITRECLQRRLREAAEIAILNGKNHITKEDVEYFQKAVENATFAKQNDFLDDGLDLHEFERLSRNLDVRFLAKQEVDPRNSAQARHAAPLLSGLLQRHLQAPDADLHVMLTDCTMAEIAQTLLCMLVASPKSGDAAIKSGIVDIVTNLMLYPPQTRDVEERPMAETPELQGRLCCILACVVIRSCDDEDVHKRKSKALGAFGAKMGLLGNLSGKTPHSAEGDKALSSLLRILKEKMELNEHSGAWSAVRALNVVAKRPSGAKKILMAEGLPLIQKAHAYYRSLRGLPPKQKPKKLLEPTISYESPSLEFPKSPALWRSAPGVMETLRIEEAKANPQQKIRRKTLLDMVGPDDEKVTLLGLLKEDEAWTKAELAHLRVTDKNMMALQLRYLERAVESASVGWKRAFIRPQGGQRGRRQSIESGSATGGTDMSQATNAPAFQRSLSKPEFADGEQPTLRRDSTEATLGMQRSRSFADTGRATLGMQESFSIPAVRKLGSIENQADSRVAWFSRMSFVG